MIHIYKASAGSGKTYTLAKQYISLLLKAEHDEAFKNILAVTFTNKATDEMKSRILLELHILSTSPQESSYFSDFVPEICDDISTLQYKARRILRKLLHDYSVFSVSTIDRFFQQTLKAFAREIGQFASYQIELNKDILIEESVDRVLDNLTDNKTDAPKLKWLTDNTLSQIETGGGFKLDYTLLSVAKRLKSEEHRVLLEKFKLKEDEIYSEQALNELSKGCVEVQESFIKDFTKAKQDLVEALEDAGIDPEDTYRGFLSDVFAKSNEGEILNLTDSQRTRLESTNYQKDWFAKKNEKKADFIGPEQEEAINAFVQMYGEPFKVYSTALLLESQIYGFGLKNDLYSEFNDLLKEKNVLSLDDSNTILKNIIDGTDAPFIYEKTGIRYKNFLLDEFQDTSRVQWDNFYPLLCNSDSEGNYNLIVGDVKQSIYRWRQSDWKLLRDEVKKGDFNTVKEETLKYNWRSMENVIKFNNDFFKKAAEFLDGKYGGVGKDIQDIYGDVEQRVGKKKEDKGQVICTFCNKDDELQAVYKAVSDAQSRNYAMGDIAILVRARQEGEAIAAHLMSAGIKVVTDDSLLISSALTVRRLVALLSRIDNPNDKLSEFLAKDLDVEIPNYYNSIVDLCEELLRGLKAKSAKVFESEILYIQSFMDKLREYITKYGNDLHGFLKSWETNEDRITSPSYKDAITVMTIHKAKGLDFPYVIVPFLEKVEFYRSESKWAKPRVEGTPLENSAKGIYDVWLSNKSEHTLFDTSYQDELLMQFVDNLNIVYVAFTRAEEVVHIIGDNTMGKDISNFAQFLYYYITSLTSETGAKPEFKKIEAIQELEEEHEDMQEYEEYVFGESFNHKEQEKNIEIDLPQVFPAEFCSWKLEARLKNKVEAIDFFAHTHDEDDDTSKSSLSKGILLHDILSKIDSKEDINYAVTNSVLSGVLDKDSAEDVKQYLNNLINQQPTWFGDTVKQSYNEATIVDLNGKELRPDRVVILEDKVIIIDYKTGAHLSRYENQLRDYAKVYEEMGYRNIYKYLWYIQTGKLKEVL